MSSQTEVVDGQKQISSSEHPDADTSKSGWPIVETGARVDCAHCEGVHVADFRDSDVGIDVPGGHKRRNHFTCPETGNEFAAEEGSRR